MVGSLQLLLRASLCMSIVMVVDPLVVHHELLVAGKCWVGMRV